jgi:hypothetical protein
MRNQDFQRVICCVALAAPLVFAVGEALAGDRNHPPADTLPAHFGGLLNDHTPASVSGGPYEMRGKWTLDVDERRGTGAFSAAMDMQTSDYGIIQGNVMKDEPGTRKPHTHHISVTDGVLTLDWAARCPQFSPPVKEGFAITGTAFVTGNGAPAPFGNPSPVTLCVLGADNVKYANVTLTIGAPASNHFGTQPIHGVVLWCAGRFLRPSGDCTLQE